MGEYRSKYRSLMAVLTLALIVAVVSFGLAVAYPDQPAPAVITSK